MADREWNETTPANTDNFNQGAAKIREHKEDTRQRAEVDHYWQTDRNYDGEHKKVTLRDTTDPTNASGKSFLYAKDDSGTSKLYWEDSDGNVSGLISSVNETNIGSLNIASGSSLKYNDEYLGGFNSDGNAWYIKEIAIGDWDMDASNQVAVTHGVTNWKTIRFLGGVIRNDTDETYHQIGYGTSSGIIVVSAGLTTNTVIYLSRELGGLFDSSAFNSTSYNRGYITIMHR